MTATVRTIEIAPGSDLARLLDEAEGAPLVMIRDGRRYRVEPEAPAEQPEARDPWADYDPAKLRAGIEAAAGSISPEEAERWIEDIYRWREEGTRPPDRP